MSTSPTSLSIVWQGPFDIAAFVSPENIYNSSCDGVYLLVENAKDEQTDEATESWYFGSASKIANRVRDHIRGIMFFQYWFYPEDNDQQCKSLWSDNQIHEFSRDLDTYQSAIHEQLKLRKRSLENLRIYWGATPAGLSKPAEAELIDWLYRQPKGLINRVNERREARSSLTLNHDFRMLSTSTEFQRLLEQMKY